MVNLVLDTNAWMYLAKGFYADTEKIEHEGHFEIAARMLDGIENGTWRLFSNYIIRLDWERNRLISQKSIEQYEQEIEEEEHLLRKKRNKDYAEAVQLYYRKKGSLRQKINRNKSQIEIIDALLKRSVDIPVKDEHKKIVVDWMIGKRTPFHRKSYNVGDALTFLSAVDFFWYDADSLYTENTIFISNNTADFYLENDSMHSGLQEMLQNKPFIFEKNLATALQAESTIIAEYNAYLSYANRDVITCLKHCKGMEYNMATVEFNHKVIIEEDKEGFIYNPHQGRLDFGEGFDLTERELIERDGKRFKTIDLGSCSFCNAVHIRCCCGKEHATDTGDIICGCGRQYHFSDLNNNFRQGSLH